jgi:lysophospholipase L1-like esterase
MRGVAVRAALVGALLSIALGGRTALADPLIKKGDRVVFLGDSITAQSTYTRLVEIYFRLRHPDLDVWFVNSGIGGETAKQGYDRLDQDVLAFQPTVVFVNFGMNDAGEPKSTEFGNFEKWMPAIFDKLAGNGSKVRVLVWLDTSPFDVDGQGAKDAGRAREKRIVEFGKLAEKEGKKRGIVVVPWHATLEDALTKYKKARLGRKLIPDRVHPSPGGHALMAVEILRALGEDLQGVEVDGTLTDGKLHLERPEAGAMDVAWDGKAEVKIDLGKVTPAVPMTIELEKGAPVSTEIAALSKFELKLAGLPGKSYSLAWNGVAIGKFTANQLGAGVDLDAGATARTGKHSQTIHPNDRHCGAATGAPWVDEYYCLWDEIMAKDRLRMVTRVDQTRGLPDAKDGYPEKFEKLCTEWLTKVQQDLDARDDKLRAQPHVLTIVAE